MNDLNGEGKVEYFDDFDFLDDDGKIEWISLIFICILYYSICSERELNSLKLKL